MNQHKPFSELKSETQQKHERRQLFTRCFLTAKEYELYGFNRSDKDYSYMLNFLTNHAFLTKFRPASYHTSWKVVLDNKWLFQVHYSRLGIPLPLTYGVYQPGGGTSTTGKPLGNREQVRLLLDELRPESLVIKPVDGIMGRGVVILNEVRYEGGLISAVTNNGYALSFDDIATKLDTPTNVRRRMVGGYDIDHPGYILQAKLSQHDFLNAIAPYTTNTMRVVTFLDCNNKVHVHFTILRVGRRGKAADNWDQGGISIQVDRSTGVLGRGVIKPKYGGQWVDTHPDSGVTFAGLKVPYWDEVLELCSRAAEATPSIRTVGWDVALTPTGPVLIEGNPDWDLPMVQVHTAGLLQPEVREQLAPLGLEFPKEKLPPISVREWWVWFRYRQMILKQGNWTLPRRLLRFILLLFDRERIYRKLGLATRSL